MALLPIAIVGAGLFYLATRRPVPANPVKKGGGGGPTGPTVQGPASGPAQGPPTSDNWGSAPDVGGNVLGAGVPDTVTDNNGQQQANDFMANNGGFSDTAGFRQLFVQKVWGPACNVYLKDLTSEDIYDAFTFLSCGGGNQGKFVRRDELGTRFKAGLAGIAQEQTGEETASIVGAIESIIPLVGTALSSVTNSAQGALQSSAGQIGQDLSNIVHTAVSPSTLAVSPGARAIMAPSIDSSGVIAAGEYPLTREDLLTPIALDGPANYDGYGWEGYRKVHARLLTRTPYGWLFPWLCAYFDGLPTNSQGSGQTFITEAERINRRARVYRAIDLIICLAYPVFPSSTKAGFPGCYVYQSKKWGPIFGSCIPPNQKSGDETFYVDYKGEHGPVGQIYKFDGTPGANIVQVQQAGHTALGSGDLGKGSVGTTVINPAVGISNPGTVAKTTPTINPGTVAVGPTSLVPPTKNIDGSQQGNNPQTLVGAVHTVSTPPNQEPDSSTAHTVSVVAHHKL